MCDPAEHGRRRRIWNRAFTAGAIKSYEPHLTRHVANLVVKLDTAATSGETLDMAATFTVRPIPFLCARAQQPWLTRSAIESYL
jgi:cytochrome P450